MLVRKVGRWQIPQTHGNQLKLGYNHAIYNYVPTQPFIRVHHDKLNKQFCGWLANEPPCAVRSFTIFADWWGYLGFQFENDPAESFFRFTWFWRHRGPPVGFHSDFWWWVVLSGMVDVIWCFHFPLWHSMTSFQSYTSETQLGTATWPCSTSGVPPKTSCLGRWASQIPWWPMANRPSKGPHLKFYFLPNGVH